MEEKKWFVLYHEQIQGPFTVSDIEQKFTREHIAESKFWARGKPYWLAETQFKDELHKEREFTNSENKKQSDRLWKIRDNDSELEPMPYEKLLIYLKSKKNLANIKIWTEGYKDWQEVYQVEKILDELGVNRRQHPRVPIKAKIEIATQNGSRWEAELSMISQGGFGLKNAQNITIGEVVRASISSQSLPISIHCTAEVVFINTQGFAGFSFVNISTEAKTFIIAYVKQFIESHPNESFTKML